MPLLLNEDGEELPNLEWHNNQSGKKYIARPADQIDFTSCVNKDINAVDGLYKNENCSCLDGNACIDPECCKDWKNREAVAAESRKRKGMRDESGKQL